MNPVHQCSMALFLKCFTQIYGRLSLFRLLLLEIYSIRRGLEKLYGTQCSDNNYANILCINIAILGMRPIYFYSFYDLNETSHKDTK